MNIHYPEVELITYDMYFKNSPQPVRLVAERIYTEGALLRVQYENKCEWFPLENIYKIEEIP